MKRFFTGLILLSLIFISFSCGYKYAYRLLKSSEVEIKTETIPEKGVELLTFLPDKYYKILGVVGPDDKLLQFHTRLEVLVKQDGNIHGFDMDGEPVKFPLSNVKYFYVKRKLQTTEEELADP